MLTGEVWNLVVILDAGAQYCKVIDRRVRELNIRSEIMPFETRASAIADKRYKGVIISGGPNSLADNPDLAAAFDLDILKTKPVLGICYGMQLLNVAAGGSMERKTTREDGVFDIDLESSPMWKDIDTPTPVLLTHGDSIGMLSPEYDVTARSSDHSDIVVGIAHKSLPLYGVQFHPEVNLTENGVTMLKNFLVDVCGCRQTYTPQCRQLSAIEYIQKAVGPTASVLVLASGGVDSTVVCALLSKALPHERIFAIHIDTGFMRHEESESVMTALSVLGLQLHYIDARERFAHSTTVVNGVRTLPLHQVQDPELKRQIIGDCFMSVCDEELRRLGLDAATCVLAQGSLRPDLIESGSPSIGKAAHVIKTHHNDTAIVRHLRELGRIVEPLRDYHKDEVRALGVELGLSESLVWRQPFPGPGLAIRIICASQPYLPPQHESVIAQLKQFNSDNIAADLLPIRTVGVQGDGRSYASCVGIRSSKPNWIQLMSIASSIPKKVHSVNRVVFLFPGRNSNDDLHTPVPLTITPSFLGTDEIALVRAADKIVNEILLENSLHRVLAQVPVILFPADFGVAGKRCITLRPFVTHDFMTGVPAVPGRHFQETILNQMVERILSEIPDIERVCYDLTAKPPGTTEWE